MSLISFHRLLIATGILFCGGFAAWQLERFFGGGGPGDLALGLAFGAAALGLLYYLIRLDRFLGRKS